MACAPMRRVCFLERRYVGQEEFIGQSCRVLQLDFRGKSCELSWSHARNLTVESDSRHDFVRLYFQMMIVLLMKILRSYEAQILEAAIVLVGRKS